MINQQVGSVTISNFIGRLAGYELYQAHDSGDPAQRYRVKHLPFADGQLSRLTPALQRLSERLERCQHAAVARQRGLELVEGTALLLTDQLPEGQRLAALIPETGIGPIPHALGLWQQVVAAVAAAHACGVVHGSLSADSIEVRPDGRLWVDGFGVAALLQEGGRALSAVVPPPALAPELQHEAASPTIAGDVYALGALLVTLLSGRPPAPAASDDTPARDQLAARRPGLPEPLLAMVAGATAPDPRQRTVSAAALAEQLGELPQHGRQQQGALQRALAAVRGRTRAPGREPEMVTIPAGIVTIGSELRLNEEPIATHQVGELAIARHPVTNRQYRLFCEATGHDLPPDPPGWGDYGSDCPDHPVINLRWADAVAYCRWLSERTGEPYRLPTEIEWERAARGGLEASTYPWGEEPPYGRAHFAFRLAPWQMNATGVQTSRVGSYQANGFGLFDMAGNVWEWCADWYGAYREDGSPPQRGVFRVARGGCWGSDTDALRCAYRMSFHSQTRDVFLGFRCVRGAAGTTAADTTEAAGGEER